MRLDCETCKERGPDCANGQLYGSTSCKRRTTVIPLMNVCYPERAEGLKRALHGKTYMNFRVTVCPAGGMFTVNVETDYDASEAEIKDFLLSVLASDLAEATK